MWSTITSPTNSTKKLIVVQKHAKLIEPQLITVENETETKIRTTIGNGDVDDTLLRQNSALRRFRDTCRAVASGSRCSSREGDVPVPETNHRSYHVTTTLAKGNSGPAKVVLTTQRSVGFDNKTPLPTPVMAA